MELGEKIRQLRTQKKLTQDDMAEALNISQRAYSKIENDEVQIKIDRLHEIAKIMNIEVSSLLNKDQHQVFNSVLNSQIGYSQTINHNVVEKERDLYDKIINRQQEEIDYLKGIIEVLKK